MRRRTILTITAALGILAAGTVGCSGSGERELAKPGPYAGGQVLTPAPVPEVSKVTIPNPPSGLDGEAVSKHDINLWWRDNSDDEDGFFVYRDGRRIGTVGENVTSYHDTGLEAGRTYTYTVKAYNVAGLSFGTSCEVTTKNPGIAVTLDYIQVHDDHDGFLMGPGEIYVYVAISDGGRRPVVTRIPSEGAISLNNEEISQVGKVVFKTDSVGDQLRIVVVGFESDPAILGAVKQGLADALVAYITGGTGLGPLSGLAGALVAGQAPTYGAVSYTHLTLPTN